jgi:hypothetical protein
MNNPQNNLATTGLAGLLHNHVCPVNGRCMACDCVECLQAHMEQEVQPHGDH